MKWHPVEEAVERAVVAACRELAWYEHEVRQIVRAEVDHDTLTELRAAAGAGGEHLPWLAFMRGEAALEVRGVSFYAIERLHVPWRVIGVGHRGAIVTEAKKAEPTPRRKA